MKTSATHKRRYRKIQSLLTKHNVSEHISTNVLINLTLAQTILATSETSKQYKYNTVLLIHSTLLPLQDNSVSIQAMTDIMTVLAGAFIK